MIDLASHVDAYRHWHALFKTKDILYNIQRTVNRTVEIAEKGSIRIGKRFWSAGYISGPYDVTIFFFFHMHRYVNNLYSVLS